MKRTSTISTVAGKCRKGRAAFRIVLTLVAAALCCPGTSFSQIDIFTEDLDAFDASNNNLGNGATFGAEILPPVTDFNDGNALRMYDFHDNAKPQLQGDLAEPLFDGFIVDFQSINKNTVLTNEDAAIRWRMGNDSKEMTSEERVAFSLSWIANGTLEASYGTVTGTIESVESASLVGVKDVRVVANGNLNRSCSYTMYSTPRTIDPLSYDVYIDGVLLNDTITFPEIPNTGLPFVGDGAPEYTPEGGIQRFALLGSSSDDTDPDVHFDNIVLTPFTITPSPQPITSVQMVTGVEGLSFLSETGVTYFLQWSTNATEEFSVWADAGMSVAGDGGSKVLFDPAGFDVGKAYRVVEGE